MENNTNKNVTVNTIVMEFFAPDGKSIMKAEVPADISNIDVVKQMISAFGGLGIPDGAVLKKGSELFKFHNGKFSKVETEESTPNIGVAKIFREYMGNIGLGNILDEMSNPEKMAEAIRQSAQEVQKQAKAGTEAQEAEAGVEEDNKANVLKGLLAKVITAMDTFLGVSTVGKGVRKVLNDELGKNKFLSIANKIDSLIREEVELLTLFGDDESLKDALFLKTLIGDEGKEVKKKKSVFEVIFSAFAWLAEKIDTKLRKIGVKPDGTVGLLGKSIAAFLGVIEAGGRLIFEVTLAGLSVTIAGVLRLADIVLGVVRKIFLAAKELVAKRNATEKVAEQ